MIGYFLTVAGYLAGPVMRWIYPPARMQNRILCVIPGYGPELYINRHQAAITGILLRLRNGLPFKLKFEPIILTIGLDARQDLGTTSHQDRFELNGYGGETTLMFAKYKLSTEDKQWVEKNASEGAETFCLNSSLNGKAYFKTWFGEFDFPINLVVRTFVDLRDDRP
jgi:hypothetical protein